MTERKKWERKRITHNTMKDMWEFYKENYKNPVDSRTYTQVCYMFNKMIADSIIRESFEFKMPFKLGRLRIKAGKQKFKLKDGKIDTRNSPINWKVTKEVWREMYPDLSWDKDWNILSEELKQIPDKKLIMHVNEHNNGYINRWYWDRALTGVKNYTAYLFRPVKGGIMDDDNIYFGKRGLAAWIKDDERTNEYYE